MADPIFFWDDGGDLFAVFLIHEYVMQFFAEPPVSHPDLPGNDLWSTHVAFCVLVGKYTASNENCGQDDQDGSDDLCRGQTFLSPFVSILFIVFRSF